MAISGLRPHGWLVLDKPAQMGSTQAVAAVKRVLRQAGHGRVKVGHGGTLDPLAQGVLPIALGEATKLAGRLLDGEKTYAFTIAFGTQTDTLDAEGQVIATSERRPSLAAVAAICARFTGPISQVPPAYSALKVDGVRAYARARAGEAVEPAAREVVIHALGLAPDHHAGAGIGPAASRGAGRPDPAGSATLIAQVSKGTYIRSLARDIAQALGTCGHVTYLRRLRAGPFTEAQAISLDKLNEIGKGAPLKDHLLPLEAGLDGIPALRLDFEGARAVRQGRIISGLPHADGLFLATGPDGPVALVELSGGVLRIVRGFNFS